jgi:transposase
LERPFAHLYETGGMRRVYLRGHTNIRKRLLIHTGGFNLGLLMRILFGVGTPRSLQGRAAAFLAFVWCLIRLAETSGTRSGPRTDLQGRSVTYSRIVNAAH